ncbi:flagellar biosynthesis protein FlhF [Cytobacillus sp. IB215665]|uniref:flagellar biosynthesis protein FlhF n=1 Tax=Cytobacillus sp. IB215665 TaxID=3097357 RepID=UPI002A13A25E|nr:flagellar biosynthesis protein FlhF [Cytobacillus sp. IB215665]MDX8365082.1 flagellar biosynthesis protein FlhF [Cytobacillus sp. IB215665]
MKIKKYLAPSMSEAMKKIRHELGSDAVILNSKVVQKGGFLGFFSKKQFEVIAVQDPEPFSHEQQVVSKKQSIQGSKGNEMSQRELHLPNETAATQQADDVLTELKDIKVLMENLNIDIHTNFEKYPDPLKEINERLVVQELSDSLRLKIMDELLAKWHTNSNRDNDVNFLSWTKQCIIERITPFNYGGVSFSKKFVNVVGPTGVGKTTTLAKLAAQCVLNDKKKVAFITTDTYRIAAIEQLKTYAKILDVPIEVCYNIEDFQRAKDKFDHYDVVFVDTAGRNFLNQQYVEDLKEIIDFNEDVETFLVLSLTSKFTDMKQIYKQFSMIHIDQFIFTKEDETSTYGSMLNLIDHFQIGVAYITNGQNVPDDIKTASPQLIGQIILGEESNV